MFEFLMHARRSPNPSEPKSLFSINDSNPLLRSAPT
uniref:Uncharacterized protein n=1 Tax=Arundo donax TaxID=35708 RepID=A0A0A9EIS8_ARUDO